MAACSHLPKGWAGAGEEQVPAHSGFSQSKGGEREIVCHVPQTQSAEGQVRECLGVPEAEGRGFARMDQEKAMSYYALVSSHLSHHWSFFLPKP